MFDASYQTVPFAGFSCHQGIFDLTPFRMTASFAKLTLMLQIQQTIADGVMCQLLPTG